MIWSFNFWSDIRRFQVIFEWFWSQKIINAPSDVFVTAIREITPPGIRPRNVRIEMSEWIDKFSCFYEFRESSSFLIGETRVSTIAPWIRKVDIFMRDIQISTNNHRFLDFESFHIIEKKWIPELTIFEPFKFTFRIRSIDCDEEKFVEFKRDDSSFVIVFWHTKTIRYIQWFYLRKHCRPRISFFLRAIPKNLISKARKIHLRWKLVERRFYFLKSDNIRIFWLQKCEKSFLKIRSDSIHIPWNEFEHFDGLGKE